MAIEITDELKKDFEEIGKNLKLISLRINEIINFYFDFGWFFDYDLPIDSHTFKIFKEEIYLLDGYMIMCFDDNIAGIETLLVDRFPERSKIITTAFKAHREQNYETSIPLLLIQTDGMFRDITNKELFSKRENQRAELILNEIDENERDRLKFTVLSIFKRYKQLSASFSNYKEFPFMLHRNLVLHGYQNDYANKTNAYKAISLINFVGKIVFDSLIYIKK